MRESGVAPKPMRGTTPQRITGSIRRFLATLELSQDPAFLIHSNIDPGYGPGYCLNNCEAESQKNPGVSVVFGWVVWELRTAGFIEAEFHAIVKRGGVLIDITPRKDAERTVLFAPDSSRNAVRVDNRTWKTWNNHRSQRGVIVQLTSRIEIVDLSATIHA